MHPDHNKALPLHFEPITHRDGTTKNDCERNAAKRLLQSVRDQYPDRDFVVNGRCSCLERALHQGAATTRNGLILAAKEGNNPTLFDKVFVYEHG